LSASSRAAPGTRRPSRAKPCGAGSRIGSTAATLTSKPPSPPNTPSDVPDVLAPGLRVVFCGINPGRVSAAAHAHFANPRNDFWRLLHAAGFSPRLLDPTEQFDALRYGIGITNAAHRTTPGSGDLRRADFEGSAERLERLAQELGPQWIAFVGKEAYRGAFSERSELGVQDRRLGDTQLFVLPSTSPANAAVPWTERLRWFRDLAGRASGLPMREAVRALVVDSAGRTLLVRFEGWRTWWTSPGGGVEPGETDEQALARELAEECGLRNYELGPLLWTRESYFLDEAGYGGQRERHYLVRANAFEPVPDWSAQQLAGEGIEELRWFTADELGGLVTAPLGLAVHLRDLLERGPSATFDAGF
jgi:TDG/mug DNA glycosylase family protein